MRQRTILVIGDDPPNSKLVHALLTLGGYRVCEAAAAEEGIALARERVPDCIVMDLQLPGMDGISATRMIKQDPALQGIPLIALTAFAVSADEQRAMAAGCDAHVTKPIDSTRLMGAIEGLAQRTASSGAVGVARVLIVDDEAAVGELLSAQLRREGCETVVACAGEEAIRMAQETSPDLVLLDVLMPGLDGYEVTRRLKSDPATSHIPVILITALSDVHDKLKGLEAGADEFLTKPFSKAELVVRIRNLLRLKQYEEQLRYRSLPVDRSLVEPEGTAPERTEPAGIVLMWNEGEERSGVQRQLEGLGHRVVTPANRVEDLFAGDQRTPDLVILDAALHGADTGEICRRLKEREDSRHTPLVVVAGEVQQEERIRFLTLGADELLTRPIDLRELAARIGRLLKQKSHLDSLQRRYRSALSAATNDGLTNLFNHVYFKRFLELEVKRSQRQSHPTSLVLIDLDDFKAKNDTLGHAAGDLILSEVASRIRSSIREIDLPARYGGEEFAVVLPYTDKAGARVVAERIRAAIASEEFLRGTWVSTTRVTASLGIASCPEDARLPGDLIHVADTMLYRAKNEGKNTCCGPGS